jgi:ecotin
MAQGRFNAQRSIASCWLAVALTCTGAAITALPVTAIPRLDLSGYPVPAPGLKRWVIQPSGLLPKSSDPLISANPHDWRVQLLVGKEVDLDCNHSWLSGSSLRMQRMPEASGKALFVVSGPLVVMSTRMACPPDQALQRSFLSLGKQPYLVPYNPSWPIVVDLPNGAELRWRIWKAETRQLEAVRL